jgi:chromosome segregation ATPase
VSEPSKEALEMARGLDWTQGVLESEVAAALQKLMDERDTWRAEFESAMDRLRDMRERAEAAEAKVKELVEALEAHDVHVGMTAKSRVQAILAGRRIALEVKAETELAQLCKDMREWFEKLDQPVSRADKQWFYGFLGAYEK